MTINLSSKSSGGGGGNAVSDPRELPSYLSYRGIIDIKYGTSNLYNDLEASFWSYYGKGGTVKSYTSTSNGTYITIIDITNKQGILYNLISPVHHQSLGTGEIKFKITVDGIEYIIGPAVTTTNRTLRFSIAPFLPIIAVTSVGDNTPSSPGSYYDTGYFNYYVNASQPERLNNIYLSPPGLSSYYGSAYLSFKESLKCEVLVNMVHDSIYYRYVGINYYTVG